MSATHIIIAASSWPGLHGSVSVNGKRPASSPSTRPPSSIYSRLLPKPSRSDHRDGTGGGKEDYHHTHAANKAMGKMRMPVPSLFRLGRRSKSPPPPPQSQQQAQAEPAPAGSPPRTAEEEMARVFRKFDANGDGRISRSELADLFESLGHAASDDELARMMAEADADGDGFISLDEFAALNATVAGDAAAVEEDLRHAFRVFDADGNGTISAAELARVLRGLGESASVAQCRRMIEGVDQNGDGLISFEEFKVMMAGGGCFAKIA